MFAPAAPAKPIVPNRRRTNRGRHACVTFKWPSPSVGGAFVPNIFFFLPGFRGHQEGGFHLLLWEAWLLLLATCDYGPHMVVLHCLTKTQNPGSWAEVPVSPALPPPTGPQRTPPSLLLGPFHCAGAFVLPFWGSVPPLHSLSFVRFTYNMPPTSIPEM